MWKKQKYRWFVPIIGLLFLLAIFFLGRRQPWRQAIYPVHWESGRIQKMVITAYDQQAIAELRKDNKQSYRYCVTIDNENAMQEVIRVMRLFSTAKPACEKSALEDSAKKYEVVGYDSDGNDTERLVIYDRYIEADKIYELENTHVKDQFTQVCAKYNDPHIEGVEDTCALKQYASERNVYTMDLLDTNVQTEKYREVFTQLDLDGKITKQYADADITNILGVTSNEIIVVYSNRAIYAVPYEKKENANDNVQMEKSEFLFEGNEQDVIYFDPAYLFSIKNLELYLYDLANRQTIDTTFPSGTDTTFMWCKAMRCGSDVVLLTNTGVFYLEKGKTEWMTITTGKKVDRDFSEVWGKGRFVYHYEEDDASLYCWNSEQKEESVFVDAAQIQEVLSKMEDIAMDSVGIDKIFLVGETVYLQVVVIDRNYDMHLYYLQKDLVHGKLKPAKKMMQAFANMADELKLETEIAEQSLYFMTNDKCYLYYYSRENAQKQNYVLYDRKKNKLKALKENSRELNQLREYKPYKKGYFYFR